MSKRSVHLYPTSFLHETRILRVSRTLIEHKAFECVLVVAALRDSGASELEEFSESCTVWRVPTFCKRSGTIRKICNIIEWSLRALIKLQATNYDCISAHSLSVLPVAWLASALRGAHLIYEPHEIETETTETGGLRGKLSKVVERVLITRADAFILTSNGHKEWYENNYGCKHGTVVRNTPYKYIDQSHESVFRAKFAIPESHLIFLYQGAITVPRGIDILLQVFSRLEKRFHIVFMGFGADVAKVIQKTKCYSNIHYMTAVHPDNLRHYTSGADVGIHMMDSSCVNHLYALPNKPMEYMNAGIPAVVSDLPEMGKLITESGGGWVVPVNDAASLQSLIEGMTSADIAAKREFAKQWALANYWEKEKLKLLQVYQRLGYACVLE